eukprot:1945653-Pleurochrysis_carterae.AAC.4
MNAHEGVDSVRLSKLASSAHGPNNVFEGSRRVDCGLSLDTHAKRRAAAAVNASVNVEGMHCTRVPRVSRVLGALLREHQIVHHDAYV